MVARPYINPHPVTFLPFISGSTAARTLKPPSLLNALSLI